MTARQRSNILERSEKGLGPVSFKRLLSAGAAGALFALLLGRLLGFAPGCIGGALMLGATLALTHPVEGMPLVAYGLRSLRGMAAVAAVQGRDGWLAQALKVTAADGQVEGADLYQAARFVIDADQPADDLELLGEFAHVRGQGLTVSANPFSQEELEA